MKFCLIYVFIFLCFTLKGQEEFEISGVVKDNKNEPLSGALVKLLPMGKITTSDKLGQFKFTSIRSGKYIIEISNVGYYKYTDTIIVKGNMQIISSLFPTTLTLQEVIVIDKNIQEYKKEKTNIIEIINKDYLTKYSNGSLIQTIDRLPGISSFKIGNSRSKPIIRGLGQNHVVVIENGVKHESQQWNYEQGLELDKHSIDEIEIIRGTSSLLYGSDAISGVIKINKQQIPEPNSVGFNINLIGRSNNNNIENSLTIYGRKNKYFGSIQTTLSSFGDFKIPTDSVDIYFYKVPLHNKSLRNTAGNEQNFHFYGGTVGDKMINKIYISYLNHKTGFFANAHGLEPRQVDTRLHDKSDRDILMPYDDVSHFKTSVSNYYYFKYIKIENIISFQRNISKEINKYIGHGYMPAKIPDTIGLNENIERFFLKDTYSANVSLNFHNDKNSYHCGINLEYQKNNINGYTFIIPSFNQFKNGIFLILRHKIDKNQFIEGGIRYDFSYLKINSYKEWYKTPKIENGDTTYFFIERAKNMSKKYDQISSSIGYVLSHNKWLYKINIAKGFRIPTAKELATNGINYHRFSYEIGNSQLKPEIAYQSNLSIEYDNQSFAFEITPYITYFSNYIFLNPTFEHDRSYGNGFQIFKYTQCKVLHYGSECHLHYLPIRWFQIGIIGEYVYAEQLSGEKKGYTLPFLPPPSGLLNLKWIFKNSHYLQETYLSADLLFSTQQKFVVPPEEPTPPYNIIDLSFGTKVNLTKQTLQINFQVRNLLNKKYLNHTSYYRLLNIPEPGRNFIINLSYPINIKKFNSKT